MRLRPGVRVLMSSSRKGSDQPGWASPGPPLAPGVRAPRLGGRGAPGRRTGVSPLCPSPPPREQGSAQPFGASPGEHPSPGLLSSSPVLSGSCSSGISSLSRCSTSEASVFENQVNERPAPGPGPGSSGREEPVRKDSKTPPPYSVYERTLRRPVPLPHGLALPVACEPPALPPKPLAARPGHVENGARRTEPSPRPRPLPRKVSQL